jgi:hypothetical protein
MPDIEVTVTTTPIDVYINSDPTVYIDTANQGIQGPAGPTGDFVLKSETGIFVNKSETGLFYPASNPSGFVPSSQPIFEIRPQVEQGGGELLGLAYVTEVGDKLPIATYPSEVVKWNGTEWISQKIDYSEIENPPVIPPDRLPLTANDGDALFWDNSFEIWTNRPVTTGDVNGLNTLLGNYFQIGGDSKGQSLILGTNDPYDLNFETSGTTKMSISKNGLVTVGGTGSQRIYIDTTIDGSPQIRWSGSIPNKGSRLTSKDGGGYWVTLDRVDGSAENLNVAGNLQVGSGSGIQAQRLYVRGNALITNDLTVNTSGNFLSGLFVNRIPVLTGTSGTQSQINNLSISLSGAYVTLGTNQTISGDKTFVNALILQSQATGNNQAVRADRNIFAGSGLVGGGDLTTDRTFDIGQGYGISVLNDSIAVNTNDVVVTAGYQQIYGNKVFEDQANFNSTLNVGYVDLQASYTLMAGPSQFYIADYANEKYALKFVDGTFFNLNGNGSTQIRFYESGASGSLITGFDNISATNLQINGDGNFSNNLYINNSRVATEAELTKKMIAFAIALG